MKTKALVRVTTQNPSGEKTSEPVFVGDGYCLTDAVTMLAVEHTLWFRNKHWHPERVRIHGVSGGKMSCSFNAVRPLGLCKTVRAVILEFWEL